MAGILRKTGCALGGLLLTVVLAIPAVGQIKIGETSSTMSGTLSTGYTGDYGNLIDSSHSLSFGGSGTLSGFYYNPNFVSYNLTPFWNQSRDNSAYQSISSASGLNFDSSIFAGSHFPGSISYAKAYNSEGNYAIPGVANYTTHGDSTTFGINWAETLPDRPSLSAHLRSEC